MLRCNFELMNVVLTVLLAEKDSLFRVAKFSVSFCSVRVHRCNAAKNWREATKKILPEPMKSAFSTKGVVFYGGKNSVRRTISN